MKRMKTIFAPLKEKDKHINVFTSDMPKVLYTQTVYDIGSSLGCIRQTTLRIIIIFYILLGYKNVP